MDGGVEEEISSALMRVALAADGFFLGLGLAVVAIRPWLRFSFHHKALRCLEKTPSLPHISDLLVLLEDHREQTDREGIIFSSKASSGSSSLQSNPFVIIRGRVATSSALESQFFRNEDGLLSTENSTSEKAVIVQRTQTVSLLLLCVTEILTSTVVLNVFVMAGRILYVLVLLVSLALNTFRADVFQQKATIFIYIIQEKTP